jgi:hypothetical protein
MNPVDRDRLVGVLLFSALLIAAALLVVHVTSCSSDDDSAWEDYENCVPIGAAAAVHLYGELGCPFDAELIAELGVLCALGRPDNDAAQACVTALFAMTTCPTVWPDACGPP